MQKLKEVTIINSVIGTICCHAQWEHFFFREHLVKLNKKIKLF